MKIKINVITKYLYIIQIVTHASNVVFHLAWFTFCKHLKKSELHVESLYICTCNLVCFNVTKMLFRAPHVEFEIDEVLHHGYM